MILLAIFFTFLLTVPATRANAQAYVGDYCWAFSTTDGVSGTVQLGFLWVGQWHYMVTGIVKVTSPIVQEFPAYGNYEGIGGCWNMTLTMPGRRDGNLGIDMIQAVLDPSTGSGTLERIGVYQGATETSTGTLTFIPCQ